MECSATPQPAGAQGVVICVADPGLPPLVTPGVAVLAAAVAAVLARRNILSSREVAQKKATLDLIEKFESSEHYRTLTDAFSTIRDGVKFAHLVKPVDPASKQLRGQMIDYLNHYELVAIGIRQEILDAGIYRAWMQKSFVRDWNAAAGWIKALRQRTPNPLPEAYLNYEWAALAWSSGDWWLRGRVTPDPRQPVARPLADVAALQHVDAPPTNPLAALPLDL